MGDSKLLVTRIGHALRTELLKEHFDMSYDQVSDAFKNFENFNEQATKNTELYQEIFMCEPSESIRSYNDLIKVREERKKREEGNDLKEKY